MKNIYKKYRLIFLFMAAHTVFTIMTFITPNITNGGLDIFDLRMFIGYDLAYANALINSLTTNGLIYYQYIFMPLDYIYPLLLSIFFFLFFKKVTGSLIFSLVGFITMIFDFAENTFILMMIRTKPLTEELVYISSTFTILKGYAYLINYAIFVILFIIFVLKYSDSEQVK